MNLISSSERERKMIAEDIRVELREASEYNKTRRPRPRSASFVALRSALYQITCLSDFKLEKIGSGFFADVFKVGLTSCHHGGEERGGREKRRNGVVEFKHKRVVQIKLGLHRGDRLISVSSL